MLWSADSPELCATEERETIYILRNEQPEDPHPCCAALCCFAGLEIQVVTCAAPCAPPADLPFLDHESDSRFHRIEAHCHLSRLSAFTHLLPLRACFRARIGRRWRVSISAA